MHKVFDDTDYFLLIIAFRDEYARVFEIRWWKMFRARHRRGWQAEERSRPECKSEFCRRVSGGDAYAWAYDRHRAERRSG